ncbi:MAG: DUF1461 domain-containing protein [Pseudomonadales bacterium]|nr:DUF1461 domain-containing protein [Pseudomonadales bacterium]
MSKSNEASTPTDGFSTPTKKAIPLLAWFAAFLLIIISCFYLSWKSLSSADLLYPFWYQQIGIIKVIDTYGPQNRNKDDFAKTNKQERVRLFNEILISVQDEGIGLREITYHQPNGKAIDTLLTDAEVIHLEDVANIATICLRTGLLSIALLLPLLALLKIKKVPMPKVRTLLGFLTAIFGLTTVFVIIAGPVNVFYKLHIMIFPQNHQWFFYYEDSLMTTLMYAPNLFGYIAVVWAAISFILIALALKVCHRFSYRKLV